MTRMIKAFAVLAALTSLELTAPAAAQAPIPPSITTPNKVETRVGPLFFKDGSADEGHRPQGL
jgi:hypothetical protein